MVSDLVVEVKGYSHIVELPPKTSYVSVVVREVNYQQIDNKDIARYSLVDLAVFLVLNVAVTLIMSLFIRAAAVFVMKNIFDASAGESGFAVKVAIIVGIINSLLIFACNYKKGFKISVK